MADKMQQLYFCTFQNHVHELGKLIVILKPLSALEFFLFLDKLQSIYRPIPPTNAILFSAAQAVNSSSHFHSPLEDLV